MENDQSSVTLKDIAKMAGVSITTVSRVINHSNTKVASKDVQSKIWDIVRQTNYVPNATARRLKMKDSHFPQKTQSKTIGCIYARSTVGDSNPFFSEIARSLEREAFKLGYILKYSFSGYDINDPKTYELISSYNVDGVAILGRFDKHLLSFIKKHYKYIVYTGLNKVAHADYDQVLTDGYQAAISVVKYLNRLGHTKIAYLGETKNEVRYQGYCDAMRQLNLTVRNENIIECQFSSEYGYLATKEYLKDKREVTAIFCGNDLSAIGAVKAIKESDLKVPEDISIMGIDDIDTVQYVSPMITTIHVPREELGKVTAKLLIDRINNGKKIPMKIELPYSIIERESCMDITKTK
ncbi:MULTISPECIES: LacI family DNA-binding transcriptional regulator [Mesobacillus]|uniref:Transcriptional regulator n=2 Tax=Mesobacillus TaxID=2675231 RepID=A0A0D6ZCU7_9BACI|nr:MULTISPECIES: LacI family DNA-binding transcriptional regulator [Mesobacillus]KIY23115.1 transcriptional regulator [Mesobacillus subterraneus]MDQ0415296.1 DNA-binding LacI/PurR family transcriptional regulator [Mesobacillus stamsii]